MAVIPTIANIAGLELWRKNLQDSVKGVATPRVPWNFTVTSQQGGNYLQWQAVSGADGYVVSVSTTGDFSTGVTEKSLRGNQNTTYFDTIPTANGAAPAKMFYKVRATAGTDNQPQSVNGLDSGVIASTAIAPNDTVTAPSTVRDTTTNDNTQSGTGTGNYYLLRPRSL